MIAKLFGHKQLKGWMEYFRQILVLGEYRGGKFIGSDELGNKYYEITDESRMFPFRNRYVEYSAGRSKDASQIPAEWHGWIHSIVDEPPTTSPYPKLITFTGHCENVTGSSSRYVPYNTTKPKIEPYEGSERFSGFKSIGDKVQSSVLSLLNKK